MADPDYDVDMDNSDDANEDINSRGANSNGADRTRDPGKAKVGPSKPKEAARARWEAGAQKNFQLHEDEAGSLAKKGDADAAKRKRLIKDTTPLQRGIIRHTLLILDLSQAMEEKDMRPTRFLLTLTYTIAFVREFFEQNPISQLGILGMREGLATRISELSGNPNDHISALKKLREMQPEGQVSLQNALDMARAALYHTPSHGTREVVIIMGALSTADPGDIHKSIVACVKDKLRVSIIGLAAQLHICAEICKRTNSGSTDNYHVAVDEIDYRELLMAITTPPVMRQETSNAETPNTSALLLMGFPSRYEEKQPTLCACHGNLTLGGYRCSRCTSKVCSLPTTCPSCDLTLILSTHLARSYHHLFPLLNWKEVSWSRARTKDSKQCLGCLTPFPRVLERGEKGEEVARGASESSRYECPACEGHFCVDCDVFCHEVVHNCPGCQSRRVVEESNGNGNGNGNMNMNGNGEMEGVVAS